MRETVPGSEIEYAPDGGPDPRCYRVDFGKITRACCRTSGRKWNARRGAAELLAAYRRVGLTLEEYEGPRYKRIDHFRRLLGTGRVDARCRWAEARSRRERGREARGALSVLRGVHSSTRWSTSGMSPLCESYVTAEQLNQMEPFYPLHVQVCATVLPGAGRRSTSRRSGSSASTPTSLRTRTSWLRHARAYVDMITDRLGLGAESRVVELGSNDGYLLQYFVAKGVPALGIEPAANVAEAAASRGVPTRVMLFGRETAPVIVREDGQADLIIGNNVLAQVSDLNGFVAGMKLLLKPRGVITMEFPHLGRADGGEPVRHDLPRALLLFLVPDGGARLRGPRAHAVRRGGAADARRVPAHLRAARRGDGHVPVGARVRPACGRGKRRPASRRLDRYSLFTEQVHETKRKLLEFLIGARRRGKPDRRLRRPRARATRF